LDGIANGSIQTEWYVNPDDSLNETFLATAQQVEAGSDGAFGTADDVSVGEVATTSFTDATGSTNKVYQHWADQANQPGGPSWQGDILSEGKSDYFEGEVIPHVFVYKASNNTPLVNGQSYSFNIIYNYYQQNTNAGGFAYITTYNISRTPAPNDATNPYIAPTADSEFTNGGGMQGNFYTVDANITNVSNVTYTGTGTKDGVVTVTFTYTGATTDKGIAEIYYGLYIAKPGQIPDQGLGTTDGANAWSGGSLQTNVDGSSIQLSPSAIIAGEISGLKFNDLNGDGTRDADGLDNILGNVDDEIGLAGWTIFLDKDNDGVLDAGETSTVTGAGGAYTFSVTPDADKSDSDNDPYIVREVQQAGWTQTTANPTSILITAADPTETNVNFGNRQSAPPAIDLVKTANPTSILEGSAGTVTYTYALTNTDPTPAVDPDPLTINTLIDDNGTPSDFTDDFYLVQNGILQAGVTLSKTGGNTDNLLEVGETWTYTTSRSIPSQDANTTHTNTANVSAVDDEGAVASDTAYATVTYTDVAPTLTVEKTVDANGDGTFSESESVSEGGVGDQLVNYQYVVKNTSPAGTDPVTLDRVFDTTLNRDILLAASITLAPGESYTFNLNDVTVPKQDANSSFVNTVEAHGKDNDGTGTNTATDTATVTYTDVAPTLTVEKTVDANNDGIFQDSEALMTIDGHAIYKYVVTNTSPAGAVDPLTLTKLEDDRGTVTTADDFNLLFDGADANSLPDAYVGGDTNNNGKVDFGESWEFRANLAVAVNATTPTNTNTVTVTGQDNEGSTDTATDTASVRFVDYGQIAPTGTTVEQYLHGTSSNLQDAQYSVLKTGAIQTNPGVFFYFTGRSGDLVADSTGHLIIDVVQSNNHNNFSLFDVVKNNVQLYTVNAGADHIIGTADDTATSSKLGTINVTDSGDVGNGADQVNIVIDKAAAGQVFAVSVKYDTGVVATSPTGSVHYDFSTKVNTTIVERDNSGIDLSPKKAALMLDGDAAHDGHAPVLQTAELQHVVDQAIDFWAQHGADSVDLSLLRETQVKIADLGGTQLGLTDAANVVTIDDDAAGYGWWTGDGEINLHMVDLLSTVTHEFGHVLGYEHDVMDASLAVGAREMPEFNTQIELVGVQAHQVVDFV
jgi:hypothetical protein